MLALIANTLVKRWYVFAFLAIYLFASLRRIGIGRTLVHMMVTILPMALIEELGTQTGLIFGRYHYETAGNGDELWSGHVILVSVLSWPFLTYAGWAMAGWVTVAKSRNSITRGALAIAFLLLLALAMDPITARGERWFLGRFYHWDEPGMVFGVPLMNYVGWALSLVLILTLWQTLDRRLAWRQSPARAFAFDPLGIPLYATLWLFHLVIAFAIGEWVIGMLGVVICCGIMIVTWRAGKWNALQLEVESG